MNTLDQRTSTTRAQSEAVRRLRGVSDEETPAYVGDYAGLVTRTVALALDAIVVDGVAAVVGVTVGLALSLLHLPEVVDQVVAAVLGGMFIIWSVGYFVFFWSSTGQTPGNRVMSIIRIPTSSRIAPMHKKMKRSSARRGFSDARPWLSITLMLITRLPGVWPVEDQKNTK